MNNNIEVFIPDAIKAEIMHYVHQASPAECSGLGRVVWDEDGLATITHCYLLDQVNTGVTTDLDASAVAKLTYDSRDDEGALTWWWHSHVDMEVRWSGTDFATIEQFGKNGYLLATVFNKREEMCSAYYQGGNGFLPPVFINDLPTTCGYQFTEDEEAGWEANFKAKDKRPVYVAPKDNKYKYGGAYGSPADPYGQYDHLLDKSKSTLLTNTRVDELVNDDGPEDPDMFYMRRLDMKLNAVEQEAWVELCSEQRGCSEFLITHEQLFNFCTAYDYNYEVAMTETTMGLDVREQQKVAGI